MGQQPQRTSSGESSDSYIRLGCNKKCPSCNKELPLQAFYTAGRSKAGHTRLHSHCKRCKLQRESRRRCVKALRVESQELETSSTDCSSTLPQSRGHLNRVPEHLTRAKLCTSCQQTKPLSSFYTAGRHKGGAVRWHSHCKSCKLEHEAAQRMQPRRDSRDLHKSDEGATVAPVLEQHHASAPASFPHHPHATSIPMMLQHMPAFLNPQQLQSMLLLNQHPTMFRNPVLQSQLAMLMWSQMQHHQAPMWSLPQPANIIQPAPAQQPQSMAAQSASTHQPSNPAPAYGLLQPAPSLECNSSGGSNDSGCMQAPNDDHPNAQQSPSPDEKLGRSAFDSSSRFAEDSDSAVTWAGKSRQQAQALAFPSGSVGQTGLQQSGQLSGRDLSSSQMADAAHWRMSESPAAERATAADSKHLSEPSPAAQMSTQPSPAAKPPLAHSFPHTVHQAAAASTEELPRTASSSLLADLRQAQQQQRQQEQAQLLHEQQGMPTSAEQHAQNLKRSSRQAAKAAEQAIQAAQAILSPMQTHQQQHAQQQAQQQKHFEHRGHQPAAEVDTAEPQLLWGSRKRAARVRGHRHPALQAGMLFPVPAAAPAALRVANASVSKPSVGRQQASASCLLRQPAPAYSAAATSSRAEADAGTGKQMQQPGLFVAPLAQAAAKQASGEHAPAFTPRHSRKKGKVQRSAFE